MTEPLVMQLARLAQAALQAMTIAGGYTHQPKPSSVSLDPEEILLISETELPYFHLVFPDVSGGARRFFPADQIRDACPGMVLARVDVANHREPGAKALAGAQLAADLERALATTGDRPAWHGGLAVDCRLAQPIVGYGLGADPIVIVRQPFLVSTHRTYGAA